ncbi:MAG: phosphoglucomutase/phosphomannomutase family protein [Dehalococcoidales bacterium]|nr:phosphoglucomutase/phosphomannomutase family protein [Dehalococcoidales bacterium]
MKFGTDGWRGVIAEDFTFDNVRFCAQGVADYLKQKGLADRGVQIGYDHRFASEDFAVAAAEVIAGNGIKVALSSKAIPTPLISFGVITKKAGGGIVITASHNPAKWNGFKFREENGTSVSSETAVEIEKYIDRALRTKTVKAVPLPHAVEQKLVEYLDLAPEYLNSVSKLIELDKIRHAGLKIIVDSMYGVGSGYFKTLLNGGTSQITEINSERNPAFPGINPEPIAVNLKSLASLVVEQKANVGLATDGDADRIGIIDEKGRFLTQLQVFAILALYLLEVRGERGALVKTLTSTSMIDRLGEIYRVPVFETPVGFKYVAPVMLDRDALIGGEESGGYGFRGHIPERDSIPAGLYLLDFMVRTGKTPSQLLDYLYSKAGEHYYDRIDLHFPHEKRPDIIARIRDNSPRNIEGVKVVKIDTRDGFKFILADNSWLLIRFSGTEPIMRIYTETNTQERVQRLLRFGRDLAGV